MITKKQFSLIKEKAQKFKYNSFTYLEYGLCKQSVIISDNQNLILLLSKSGDRLTAHFAYDEIEFLTERLGEIKGRVQINFVPKDHKENLKGIGFGELAEFADFANKNLCAANKAPAGLTGITFLKYEESEYASMITEACAMQSRGFWGEEAGFFREWMNEKNDIIAEIIDEKPVGLCCVAIINEGSTLWVRELAVLPEFQNKGIGSKLLGQAVRYGVFHKATKGFLMVDLLNDNAIHLYNKHGFFRRGEETELQMIRE